MICLSRSALRIACGLGFFSSALFSTILFFSTSVFAEATQCQARSGPSVTPLLELYTSQGCSSCPPAEQWLSSLKASTANESAPGVNILAYHVDYWDSLGWKDPYGRPQFSEKQRLQAQVTANPVVYTPQFTLNGMDFRGWNTARLHALSQQLAQVPSPVHLDLQQLPHSATQFKLQVSARALLASSSANIYIALYTDGLSTAVKAGENSGRVLKHDAVVRQWFGPYTLNAAQAVQQALLLDKAWLSDAAGAMVYVQSAHSGEVLQSLRLDFCQRPPA
ncbi:DUF1223 domain-containing protein [Methylophilus aquaticus]|uniref:DUF1223 domain-containing protein n=1 Tax=Methylophilus aquaticus TaxID=1971610 RepID=A0ABT9JTG8_9PROT|nr:DUF1223 domain-containing protein [Methylophilus aquaticus]MDP8567848.1 DUF1223 domain-containing protein [Methylophilus aquaticus]